MPLSLIDRIVRYILGLILFTWAIAGGPTWTYFGLYLLYSSSFGICYFYWLIPNRKT